MATQGGGNNTQTQAEIDLLYKSTGYQKEMQNLQNFAALIAEIKKDLGSVTMPAIKGMKGALADARELSHVISLMVATKNVAANASGEKQVLTAAVKQAQLNAADRALRVQEQFAKETQKTLQREAFLGTLKADEIKKHQQSLENLKAINKGLQQREQAGQKVDSTLKNEISKAIAEVSVKGTIYKDSLGKIKSGDVLGGLEGLSLRQLKKLQTQLLSHLDLTGLDTKVKENFKRALVQIDGTLKSAKRGELNLLGLEAPDTSKPLKRDKQLNIFEKARQGQLSIKDLQDFQVGSTDPKRTLKELRAIQNQIRKAELDPNLITTTDKAPNRLGNFIRTQISGLNQAIADLEKASKPVKALKEKDWSTQTREAVRSDINTLGQSRDPIARQNIREEAKRNFETKQNQAEYNKELIRHKASLNQTTIQQMTTSTELAKATKAIQLDNKLHPKNQEANLALTEAIKQRTKDLNYQARLRDPNFKASEDLKQNQTGLRTTNVGSLLQGQDLSSARQVAKVNAELEKQRAIQAGIFDSKDKLLKLSPEEHKFAKATLNYQYAMNQNNKVKREEAARLLNVLSDIEKANRRATAANQNLANLAHKYTTTGEIRAIQDRAEAELARKVVAYRMRSTSYTEEELKHQQKLLDAAKSRDHLLTSQANRQDRERQHERRLTQLTHLEGDGGASMAIIQAGFMMRSQVLGGLSSIFSGAFDSAVQLDKAFRNLQAISASTNYEMATMKVNLINVAQASKFSAAEVGETAVMLAQAGLSIQEIGASMKGIITLAQATGTDLAKSVDVVTSVLSIFNKSATETDTIVNQLTAALNESKLDINKMALGLQYAGNIANDSGVSFEELTAALGATANAGIRSGSTLGTGLRQMFIDLQKPNEKLTKRLETLGITLDQVNFRSQGLEGVLRNLRNAGFSSADAFETFEVRSAAAFSALSGNLTDFHDLQEELADTNAAFDANNVQMESFAVQLDHLKSNLGVLAAEGLGPVLSLLRDMTKGMSHAMENAEEGATAVSILTTAFVSLMAGATIAWFARLVGGLLTTTKALMGVGTALTLTRYGFIGLAAAGVTFISSLVSQQAEVDRLNTKLDEAKGKYNNLKAELQSQESALSNVDEALKNLVDRYGVLKGNSAETERVTKSLKAEFNQFGLELDDVANNKVDNLINKIQQLRDKMAEKLKQTITQEANAKLKAEEAEKDAAKTKLENANSVGGLALLSREGLDYFKRRTAPRGYLPTYASENSPAEMFKDNPEIRDLYIKYFEGVVRTQESGKVLTTKDFNPDQLSLDLTTRIGDIRNSKQATFFREQVEVLDEHYKNIKRVIEHPETKAKILRDKEKDVRKVNLEQNFWDDKALGGWANSQMKSFNESIKLIDDMEGLTAKQKGEKKAVIAKPLLAKMEKGIKEAKKYIKSLPEGLAKEVYTDLLGDVLEMQGKVRKYVEENEKEQRKYLLQSLEIQLTEAKEALKLAEKLQAEATGTNLHTKRRQETKKKLRAVQNIERKILKLKQEDNPNSSESLKALESTFKTQETEADLTSSTQVKAIKDRAAENEVAKEVKEEKAKLAAEKRIQDQFFKDIENQDKYLKVQQDAERRQAKARTYIPLTSGNMFDQLSADEKKAAQAKANTTGVAQEYSVFGKTSNPFARQAARLDSSNLEKRLVQQQLAREVTSLSAFQDKKSAIDPQKLLDLRTKNDVLDKEVKRLREIAANSKLEFDKKELANAEEQLELNKERILAAEDYELRLSQAIEERTNNVNALKDTLQALTDKYNTLDTTLSAGVQSMTSGLSSIFSDWASGVIQNTEDVRDAFEALGKSVLQSMAKVVSDRIAQQFMGFILNGLGNMFDPKTPAKTPALADGAIQGLNVNSNLNVDGMSTGGLITTSGVKHFARGGEVTGTNIGRDSVPALLQPNEYVVQRSAVQALGTDFMQNLNNVTAGSLKQGAANLGGSKPMVQNVMKSSPPVNVYVVSPEQQRQMGQQDVVVALQDDILRGGTTKKLIKAVISGEV